MGKERIERRATTRFYQAVDRDELFRPLTPRDRALVLAQAVRDAMDMRLPLTTAIERLETAGYLNSKLIKRSN